MNIITFSTSLSSLQGEPPACGFASSIHSQENTFPSVRGQDRDKKCAETKGNNISIIAYSIGDRVTHENLSNITKDVSCINTPNI